MTYDALTIDTQVVYANGRHLDRGLVAELEQYKDGLIQVVLSEVVFRELLGILTTKAKEPHDALTKVMREGLANGQIGASQKTVLQTIIEGMVPPDHHAKEQLRGFVESTGAQIIPAEKAHLKAILGAYFKRTPPFAGKGKKSEFPDAISLLSLEAWAREHNKKILTVSNDSDWSDFASQSEFIDCVNDLGKAMAMLSKAAAAAEPDAHKVLAKLAMRNPASLRETLDAQLHQALESETPYVEFDSSMPAEEEGVSLSLMSYEIHDPSSDSDEATVVRIRADGFVMRVPITVKAMASVDFTFSIYDSIDKDFVPMGSTSVEREVEFEAQALIDCTKHDTTNDAGMITTDYEIESAQIVGAPPSIDIGYVDYSLAGEEFDPEEWNEPPVSKPST